MQMATEERNRNGNEKREESSRGFSYLIVRPEKGRIRELFRFLVSADEAAIAGFLESSDEKLGPISGDHRWVIVVSIIVRKIIAVQGKPMEWTGCLVEFVLNLLSENGDIPGLVYNLFIGKVVMPQRDSETFISAIGHLDGRVDLFYEGGDSLKRIAEVGHVESNGSTPLQFQTGIRALMDLCIMASKLAYENASVVRNIVLNHWKMHLVDFYNCWNDFQKERSTQVFILCDKPRDANLILISFRGTEPFDADDWSTDFDYSWYEIPKLGRIHMGFLEALGLGNRADATTFQKHLQEGGCPSSSGGTQLNDHSDTDAEDHPSDSSDKHTGKKKKKKKMMSPEMDQISAYYTVRSKLRSLLQEHSKAKFVVTGHSLGGALAILLPTLLVLHEEKELMQRLLGVYTFGQPRVGDGKLGRFMEAHLNLPIPKYFRVVYCNDLVPRLPYDDNTFLYKHFGSCLYYDSRYTEQEVEEEPNRNYFGMKYLIPEYLNAVWELIRSLTMAYTHGPEYKERWFSILLRVVGLALPGISAHCPTDYVNSVRLGIERVQMASI